jgi:hypothetical protein
VIGYSGIDMISFSFIRWIKIVQKNAQPTNTYQQWTACMYFLVLRDGMSHSFLQKICSKTYGVRLTLLFSVRDSKLIMST